MSEHEGAAVARVDKAADEAAERRGERRDAADAHRLEEEEDGEGARHAQLQEVALEQRRQDSESCRLGTRMSTDLKG